MNKAMEAMKTSRRSGMGVSITTQVFVDRTGKNVMLCSKTQDSSYLNVLKFNTLSLQIEIYSGQFLPSF
jgi:hypothetical protein